MSTKRLAAYKLKFYKFLKLITYSSDYAKERM